MNYIHDLTQLKDLLEFTRFLPDAGSLDHELASRFIEGSEEAPESIYQKMGILTLDTQGHLVCSVAGVLLGTRRPDQILHGGACIEAVHYAGTERDSDMQVTARRITGPVDRQILDAFDFVRGSMLRPATKEPARIERPAFSDKAVFEGIANAVVHRDYSVSGSRIRVFVFSDRLEIYSPGALPNTLTVDTLRYRQFTRNETLVGLLGRLRFEIDVPDAPIRRGRFMESRGEGVPIIFRESKALGAQPPVYELFHSRPTGRIGLRQKWAGVEFEFLPLGRVLCQTKHQPAAT